MRARVLHSICGKCILGKFRRPPGQRSSIGQRVGYRPVARRMRRDLILRERNECTEGGKQVCLSERSLSVRAKADCLVK